MIIGSIIDKDTVKIIKKCGKDINFVIYILFSTATLTATLTFVIDYSNQTFLS